MAEEQEKSIFREKSLKRISSPEQMDDYIRVTSPSVWLILMAMIVLLIGIVVWAVFGTVTIQDADGMITQVHPITFVMN
ncbi:MAG: hypothetical protein IJ733_01000 [Lachnospiraceae bacterium]|nr:hypothetical protein [Lachnospiraceae bacterium]